MNIFLCTCFLLLQVVPVWAAATTFTVSATVPDPSDISMTVSSVNSSTGVFTTEPQGTTALNFDPLTFNSTNKIYIPDHYFALDIGVVGGSGSPDTTVTYTEGANPNGSSNGMGVKSTATFAKEVTNSGGGTTETLLTAHGPKKRLIDLNGEHITFTEVSGGFLRIYVGVWTGSTANPPDPANGQPFSNADAAGEYTGSLLVSAVVN